MTKKDVEAIKEFESLFKESFSKNVKSARIKGVVVRGSEVEQGPFLDHDAKMIKGH